MLYGNIHWRFYDVLNFYNKMMHTKIYVLIIVPRGLGIYQKPVVFIAAAKNIFIC